MAWRWVKAHPKRAVAALFSTVFIAANVLAFRHAWVLTHFAPAGETTARPEELSALEKLEVAIGGVRIRRPQNDRTPDSLELAFETHRIASTGGHELEVWHIPHTEARAIVALFHGFHSSKGNLLTEARAFHDMQCSTLLVDFRGSGGSTGNETSLGVHEADDVAAAAQLAMQLEPDRPLILFGQSMGAVAILRAVSLGLAAPAAVIVECPFDRLLGTIEHRFDAMSLPSFPFAEMLVFWGSVQHRMNGFAHNPLDYATAIRCPVLQLHGELDPRVTAAEARALFDRLPGEKRFEVFEGVGHQPYAPARPELWKRLVDEFLEQVCSK